MWDGRWPQAAAAGPADSYDVEPRARGWHGCKRTGSTGDVWRESDERRRWRRDGRPHASKVRTVHLARGMRIAAGVFRSQLTKKAIVHAVGPIRYVGLDGARSRHYYTSGCGTGGTSSTGGGEQYARRCGLYQHAQYGRSTAIPMRWRRDHAEGAYVRFRGHQQRSLKLSRVARCGGCFDMLLE